MRNVSYSSLGTSSCEFDTDFSCVGEFDRRSSNPQFDEEKEEGYHITPIDNFPDRAEKGGIDCEEKNQEYLQKQLSACKRREKLIHLRITLVKLAIRTVVPLVSLGLSVQLTNFLELMSIIGAVFGLMISLVIPLLCFRRLFKKQISTVENILITFFILLSFSLMISGLWASIN